MSNPKARRRIGLRILLGGGLLLLLAVIGAFIWFKRSALPTRDGKIAVHSELTPLTGPVSIRFDKWGVPHLLAETEMDLALGLGFVHANDRITQMELQRRACSGRLSEVFGERTFNWDLWFRALQLRRAAKREWYQLKGDSKRWLLHYAEGINLWLAEHKDELPPELWVAGIRPEPWHPVDSLCTLRLWAAYLSSLIPPLAEDKRFAWLTKLGPVKARELLGDPEAHVPDTIAQLATERRSSHSNDNESGRAGVAGSNAWAVTSTMTLAGAPLLANDPHLPLSLPPTWYQVHLRAPGFEVGGMTMPGLPLVAIGQNENMAWGMTNTMLDDHDVFYERLSEDGKQVQRGDGWKPIKVEYEQIAVGPDKQYTLKIRTTDHGPLLDADPQQNLPPRSIAWVMHRTGDPVKTFLRLARASTTQDALNAFTSHIGPAQGMVLAHKNGEILSAVVGAVPQRRTTGGRFPSPGWDLNYGWDKVAPLTDPVLASNPEHGFVITANDDPHANGLAKPLTGDYVGPFRRTRIRQLVSRGRWTAETLSKIQNDTVSLLALRVTAQLKKIELNDSDEAKDAALVVDALSAWDGALNLKGKSALYAVVERELVHALFSDETQGLKVSAARNPMRLLSLLEGRMDAVWFDDVTTRTVETRNQVLIAALSKAWRKVRNRWGDDSKDWNYGDIHELQLKHPLGEIPLLGRWLNRNPGPVAGGLDTVSAFSGMWKVESQTVTFGPSMRWVADVSNGDNSLAVLPGGQSGHPFEKHYDDQIELFVEGRMHAVHWTEKAIKKATVSTLTLVPADS